ncbi:MAG TPA: aminopeptidase N [Marmoricola sp.]|nr:aminopeptidase N [Marmoricola sp.]
MAHRSLQRSEAVERFAVLAPTAYDVSLDLAADTGTFTSRTVLDLRSGSGTTFLDLKPVRLSSIRLDGHELDTAGLRDGRFPLDLTEGEHRLEVEAVMPFRNDGEGLHRATDPVDGRDYVYGMSFMSAAPSIFACFDQPDLKAPYTLHVTAPEDWLVLANASGEHVGDGRWEFAPSRPLSTYFVTLVAGPYHRVEDQHDGIPLGLLSRQSLAGALDQDAPELLTLTRQCFDEFHRLFGIRYPFGKYDQAFVPEFNAGAMENPGLVTFRDPLLFSTRASRSQRVQRATTVAHEMAHQWFGNLTTPKWWDDLWLNEAFAEYMGNRVTAEATEFADAGTWASLTRKNWGLNADSRPTTHPVAGNGAVDADAALQDFDGISYAKGHALLGQLARRVGDGVFFDGVRDHFETHAYGNATMTDLFRSWEKAGAGDLEAWTDAWLRTAGMDRFTLDRAAGELVRTPPDPRTGARPADRSHAFAVATWTGAGWERRDVVTDGDRTPLDVDDAPVLLDADDSAWADLAFDDRTAGALPGLFARTTDPLLRTTIWNTVRNAVHQVRLSPGVAVDIIEAGIVGEVQDAALQMMAYWTSYDGDGTRGVVHQKLLPVVARPEEARARLNQAFRTRVATAPPGSELQLTAYRAAVSTESDATVLESALSGELPDGLELDDDLRWRLLRRLTTLGATDLDQLDRQLAVADNAHNQLAHHWCHARLPAAEAKAWAWQRFTGEATASNYETEAVGTGFWDGSQAALLAPYVDRYFDELPGTTEVRAGWALADAALFFYPITALSAETLARSDELAADPALDPSLRRILLDSGDQVRRCLGQLGTPA